RCLLHLPGQVTAVQAEPEQLGQVQLLLGVRPVTDQGQVPGRVGVEHRATGAAAVGNVVGHRADVDVGGGEDVADQEGAVHRPAGGGVRADQVGVGGQSGVHLVQRLGDRLGRAHRAGLGAHQLLHGGEQLAGVVRCAGGGAV